MKARVDRSVRIGSRMSKVHQKKTSRRKPDGDRFESVHLSIPDDTLLMTRTLSTHAPDYVTNLFHVWCQSEKFENAIIFSFDYLFIFVPVFVPALIFFRSGTGRELSEIRAQPLRPGPPLTRTVTSPCNIMHLCEFLSFSD